MPSCALYGIAGLVDRLFYDVIHLLTQRRGMPIGVRIERQRNTHEDPVEVQSLRPDFMLVAGDAMLFKGEERASDSSMYKAQNDLAQKMADWSDAYYDKVSAQWHLRKCLPRSVLATCLPIGLCLEPLVCRCC
eukprot:GHUV01049769.1.p1 GENE.GHUV01049769.1~~GHUV01049769.1.p1  ORF type:complete len:133 (+),score=1.24 GHUV01049769.1:337-735(+)